jgi:TnpA family transposase
VASLLAGKVDTRRILERWDDLLRVAGSLKVGWVTASLLIGKLVKSVFILDYLSNEPLRRRINEQLNKGEELGALRRFLFFANEGEMRRRLPEAQTDQALCLALATNAVIVWTVSSNGTKTYGKLKLLNSL